MALITEGKVKSVYDIFNDENKVHIRFHDKVTAGNGRAVDYPEDKGKICCSISAFLFEIIKNHGIPTHFLETDGSHTMVCKKVEIIPLEVVVRNIAAGSIVRQTTIEEGTEFNWPLIEFFLKDDAKDDPLLTTDRIIQMGYNMEAVGEMEIMAREVNLVLQKIFDSIGLTLVDFKLEFGYDLGHSIFLADELSPDGMRLWKDGQSFDKDLFRKEQGGMMEAYNYILTQLQSL